MKAKRVAIRFGLLALTVMGLAGCVAYPVAPYGYYPAPGYYAAPAYYGPAVSFSYRGAGYGRWR